VAAFVLLPAGAPAQSGPKNLVRARGPAVRGGAKQKPRAALFTTPYMLVPLAYFSGPNGMSPESGLITDGNGNFYGTTAHGGDSFVSEEIWGYGTIFQYSAAGGLQTLASFNGKNGVNPENLIPIGNGSFLGVAACGGSTFVNADETGDGCIFEYSPSKGLRTLVSFTGANGSFATGPLTPDGSGSFYGTTYQGGDLTLNGGAGVGVIYKYTPPADLRTLATFEGTNGACPDYVSGGLVLDGSGGIYGVTVYGGPDYAGNNLGYGTIFKYSAANGIESLAAFDSTDGQNPQFGLTSDGNGNLFGTTDGGGAYGGGMYGNGTIFDCSEAGGLQTLASFDGTDGSSPTSTLIIESNGDLIGATGQGGPAFNGSGSGSGIVYEYSASGGLQTLAAFDNTNGWDPEGPLLPDGNGNFYGVAAAGGAYYYGVIYELASVFPMTGKISLVGCENLAQTLSFTFRPTQGADVIKNVTLAADGSYLVQAPVGTWTVAVKGPKWLQRDVHNVVVNGPVTGVSATLLPGDANGDNVVDMNDFDILAVTYGLSTGQAGFNTNADFNCDGVVDLSDFDLLAIDFGMTGDP
jgi:uncharacterized repeat protein (TIGR03803 family)